MAMDGGDVGDVGAWLSEFGLETHAEAFAENGVDGALLPDLTNEDLKDLGIVRLADRKRLLKAIAELSESAGQSEAQTPPPVSSEGERRQVTVLFADLTGFTRLSNELGAEQTHALLNRYFETVDGLIEGYGGTIDKHIGDNVMALFGAPTAHSNDPERAVRAACEIHRAMEALSQETGRGLKAHIGIASGQVIASGTGSETHREYTVTGASVNLASRLQDKAAAGETLISDQVRRAVSELADCTALGEVEVKGYATPTRTWKLDGLARDPAVIRDSPFVGRQPELRQFVAIAEGCLETAIGQSILVRGEAGIGKTRLVDEFAAIAAVHGFATHKGLVLDFGVGKGQDAIRTLVRKLLGIPAGGPKARRREAADAAVFRGVVERDQLIFLNDLLDLPQPTDLRSLYDAMDNATRNGGKQEVVAKLITSAATKQPVMVAVEDVHWADSLILAHLARLASAVATCPAVMVMTSRVEGDPLDQTWRASARGSPLTTIDLGPLRDAEAIEVARDFMGADAPLAETCVARAEGNPLFLGQLLQNVKEGAREDVPDTIQSLVLARMDRLKPDDKHALQAASVIGQRFTLDALRHLLDSPGYDCEALIEHRLTRPESNDYLFAHALIRDGVYTSLLEVRRRELHLKAAEWFADHDPVLRAEHLDRACDPGAAKAYRKAAEAQAAGFHFMRASELIERGLELAEDAAERSLLTCLKGDILLEGGDTGAAIEALRAARDLAVDGKHRCRAEIGFAEGMRMVDQYDDAFAALERAEQLAGPLNLHLQLARLHHLRGNLYFPLGQIDRCWEEHKRALEFAREAGSPEWEARALGGLGDAEYARGRLVTADRYLGRCIDLCRHHGFGRIEVANLPMLGGGGTRFYAGDVKGSVENARVAISKARAVGHDRAELIGQASCYMGLYAIGEMGQAREHIARAKELVEKLGARRFMARALHYEGKIQLWQGARSKALETLRNAMAISRETGIQYVGPTILADIAYATDDETESRDALREGQQLLDGGCVGHNYFEFYIGAMETSLQSGDWDALDRYAKALTDYTQGEPLPFTDFYIARAAALAAFGRGSRDDETIGKLKDLRDQAQKIGIVTTLPALDDALAAAR